MLEDLRILCNMDLVDKNGPLLFYFPVPQHTHM